MVIKKTENIVRGFIEKQNLLSTTDKILVAVSGGIDSVALLHILNNMEYDCTVAHCNFRLRGMDADADEQLVKKIGEELKLKTYTKTFNTQKYAQENKISIQEAARELRYTWFDELSKANNYNKIAIAHNLNDSSETILFNLIRGTGIKGLTGIKTNAGKIVRPLLCLTREQIVSYQRHYNFLYREDKSNSSIKYSRNKIRHIILPCLEEINIKSLENINDAGKRLQDVYDIYQEKINELKKELVSVSNSKTYINLQKLKKQNSQKTILFELISEYGFNRKNNEQIFEAIDTQPGKMFYSSSHALNIDREYIIIDAINSNHKNDDIQINKPDFAIDSPVKLLGKIRLVDNEFSINTDSKVGQFDFEKLRFPLTLRTTMPGDSFTPIGMTGKKKISDFLKDLKIPLIEKSNVKVLCSGNDIIWVVGFRINNNYKITEGTAKIMEVKMFP